MNHKTDLKRPPKRISITFALLANIAMMTVVIGTLFAWLITSMGTQDIHERVNGHLADTGSHIALRISALMNERYIDVREARDLFELELSGLTGPQKRKFLERVRDSHQYFSWLGLVSADGKVRTGTDGLLEGLDLRGRNWFEEALKTPVFFGNFHSAKLLEPFIRNADGAKLYLLDISMPLHGPGGKVTGVLGSHLNWQMIEEVVKQNIVLHTETMPIQVAIVNADGKILYDSLNHTGNVGELLKPLAPGAMIEATWPEDQEESFLTFVNLPQDHSFNGYEWRVVVREPSSVVNGGIMRMKWKVIGATMIAGLLFSLFGLVAVRPITRPIQILVHDIKKFGDTEAPPESSAANRIVEVSNLQDAFHDMAANVLVQRNMLRETQFEIVRTLGRAGEYRDNETGNHVLRMSLCCAHLAELAGMRTDEVEVLRLASQMHDVGKIGIPDEVLLKPGRFNDSERAIMERHCEIGNRILTGVDTPLTLMARSIAMSHHEKWDGSGYPNGIAGADIPMEGRIAAICDVFDALLSSRPYKRGWTREEVVNFMQEQSGRHFDPILVALFLRDFDSFVKIRDCYRDEPYMEIT